MTRKKGWLGRIPKYLIGGNMAMVFDVYCDMEEDVDKPYRAIEWYFSIAGTTCVELLYRQVGQHKFDPTDRMDTPVYLRVTAADLPELAKTIPRLGPADLIWLDRPVRGIDDIRQIQDELKMRSVFEDDPSDIRSYVATGAFNEEQGNLAESMRDYSAAASLAGEQEAVSRAQARALKRQGRRGEADDIIRYIKRTRGRRHYGRKE